MMITSRSRSSSSPSHGLTHAHHRLRDGTLGARLCRGRGAVPFLTPPAGSAMGVTPIQPSVGALRNGTYPPLPTPPHVPEISPLASGGVIRLFPKGNGYARRRMGKRRKKKRKVKPQKRRKKEKFLSGLTKSCQKFISWACLNGSSFSLLYYNYCSILDIPFF